MNHQRKAFALILFVIAGCKPDPEIYLQYNLSADQSENIPRDVCWLTGPSETLVLARLDGTPKRAPFDPDCTVAEPYRSSYWELELTPVRTAGSEEIGGAFTALAMHSWAYVGGLESMKAGQELLLSIRVSDSVPIVIRLLPVTTSGEDSGLATEPLLPDKWSELETQATTIQQTHETACTDRLTHGPAGSRRMTDDEFDAWIRTPAEKTCEPNNEVNTDPAPGTIEVDGL